MPAAAPRPETQEEILAAALAARDDRDIPAEDDSWVIVDSDGDRPAELAGLDGADLLPGGAVPGPGAPPGSPACPGPSRSGPDSTDGPGQPGPDSTYAPGHSPDSEPAAAPPAPDLPPGLRRPDPGDTLPPLAGQVFLTLPLATLLGLSDAPGQAVGYGPLDPDTGRALARAAVGHPGAGWHLIITDPHGRAVGYGHAPRPARPRPPRPGPPGPRPPRAGPSGRRLDHHPDHRTHRPRPVAVGQSRGSS